MSRKMEHSQLRLRLGKYASSPSLELYPTAPDEEVPSLLLGATMHSVRGPPEVQLPEITVLQTKKGERTQQGLKNVALTNDTVVEFVFRSVTFDDAVSYLYLFISFKIEQFIGVE